MDSLVFDHVCDALIVKNFQVKVIINLNFDMIT